jgi:hypothetical protein
MWAGAVTMLLGRSEVDRPEFRSGSGLQPRAVRVARYLGDAPRLRHRRSRRSGLGPRSVGLAPGCRSLVVELEWRGGAAGAPIIQSRVGCMLATRHSALVRIARWNTACVTVRELVDAPVAWVRRAGASGPQAPVVVLLACIGGVVASVGGLARDITPEKLLWLGGFATVGVATESYLVRWYRRGARRDEQ